MRRWILISSVMIFIPAICFAGEITHTLYFSTSDLTFSQHDEYDIVKLANGVITDEVGKPQLPVRLVRVALPAGSKIDKVEVVSTETEDLPGKYLLFPIQPPQVLSASRSKVIPLVDPDPVVYSSKAVYPEQIVECTGIGYLGGQGVANILIHPLRYIPSDKKLHLCTQIIFTVHHSEGGKIGRARTKPSSSVSNIYTKLLRNQVINPQDLKTDIPMGSRYPSQLPPGDYEYVIITPSSYQSYFQPLADWKTKKGVPANIVTTSWIYSNYSGRDQAEQVRNFIIDAYENWGTVWVLLGGDTGMVPDRIAFAMDCDYHGAPDENDIRADLYFSDLDGTWDGNENMTFGEVADSIDMYPDVFVGRAPVNSTYQAQIFVNKILIYEKNPPLDYQTKATFTGEVMWQDPFTDGGVAKNKIDDDFFPPRFDPINKLYQTWDNLNYSTVVSALDQGQNFFNHNGHCWTYLMSIGEDALYNWDMDALVNGNRQGIMFSIGCWPAAIDYDCIAEHFVNNPYGGGVAFVGNTRYGWGSPGNPEYGYSDRFDQEFFRALFKLDVYNIGATLAQMKTPFVPLANQENVYRWCEYQMLLLGEPEMPMWTDTPELLAVDHPSEVPLGSCQLAVTVRHDGQPVEDALVCVMKDSDVYQRGLTDSEGRIVFSVNPSSIGQISVTATKHDFLPYEGTCQVVSDGPYVSCSEQLVDDTPPGNNNGELNPDEQVKLSIP